MTYAMTRLLVVPTLLLLLAGCGGEATETTATQADNESAAYSGPVARNDDVQSFRLSLWDGLKADNRCGGACHIEGGQAPFFVRQDNINLAYDEAIAFVDLTAPSSSVMVDKVAGGHNCWLTSNSACAATVTAFIENWAGDSVSDGRSIQLEAPPVKTPGDSKSFPETSALFAAEIHPLLLSYCADCHAETAPTPQAPFISNADVDAAYSASRDKIDLDTPANSRLVVRLRQEFHNCWDDCEANANEMQAAIQSFSDAIPLTEVDQQLILSNALLIEDGTVASGGSRHESNLIALYEFKTGTGSTAFDTSGVEPAINLALSGDYSWVNGWGVEFRNGKAQGPTSSSQKLTAMIQASGEYSIEAWVTPANVTQTGPARIISYSSGTTARNFTLGQSLYNYDFLHRSGTTDGNGEPSLSTADDDETLQASQQHVVITFDTTNGRKIYVNGQDTGNLDSESAGSLIDWDDSFALILGNEASGDRPWRGKLRMVAIHNRALTPEQVEQNFLVNVGEKFFLLFNISHLVPVPKSYIVFEAAMYDSYSYLFTKPRYITLHATERPSSIDIVGIRIGINGREAKIGQAYDKVNTQLDSSLYDEESGQALSRLGTTLPMEKGLESDLFFLTFELLGSNSNVFTEPVPVAPAAPADADPVPDIGLRTFDEISASMSAITGVSMVESSVSVTFETIKQQLPSVENVNGFLSSHQVAIAQLSIEYCNALIESTSLRGSFFPGFDFSASAQQAFDTSGERDLLIDPLLNRTLGISVTTQPDPAAVKSELNSLIDTLTVCGGSCAADRTLTVAKATCAATIGSAAMLLQ
jgi:hypothetical protein